MSTGYFCRNFMVSGLQVNVQFQLASLSYYTLCPSINFNAHVQQSCTLLSPTTSLIFKIGNSSVCAKNMLIQCLENESYKSFRYQKQLVIGQISDTRRTKSKRFLPAEIKRKSCLQGMIIFLRHVNTCTTFLRIDNTQ